MQPLRDVKARHQNQILQNLKPSRCINHERRVDYTCFNEDCLLRGDYNMCVLCYQTHPKHHEHLPSTVVFSRVLADDVEELIETKKTIFSDSTKEFTNVFTRIYGIYDNLVKELTKMLETSKNTLILTLRRFSESVDLTFCNDLHEKVEKLFNDCTYYRNRDLVEYVREFGQLHRKYMFIQTTLKEGKGYKKNQWEINCDAMAKEIVQLKENFDSTLQSIVGNYVDVSEKISKSYYEAVPKFYSPQVTRKSMDPYSLTPSLKLTRSVANYLTPVGHRSNAAKAVAAIRIQKQVAQVKSKDVDEIILDGNVFNQFTDDINNELQDIKSLRRLSMIDCELISLENLPKLNNLTKLNLYSNRVNPRELGNLAKAFPYLRVLILADNPIEEYVEVRRLQGLGQLFNLELKDCPISKKEDYRHVVFSMFPTLVFLDGVARDGKAYKNYD